MVGGETAVMTITKILVKYRLEGFEQRQAKRAAERLAKRLAWQADSLPKHSPIRRQLVHQETGPGDSREGRL